MQITRSSLATGTGPGQWLTGDVYLDTIPQPTARRSRKSASAALVSLA
jgi:hypothetical protein